MSPAGPVAILTAIPEELVLLREDLEGGEKPAMVGRPVHRGQLDGVDVVLAEAGIGKVNTAVVATLLVERFGARLVVFTGVAGALDPDLAIGDVVVADRCIQYDAGVLTDEGLDRYQAGHVPFFNPTDRFGYTTSTGLLEKVRVRLEGFALPALSREAGGGGRRPRVVFGIVLTGDAFVTSEVHAERLRTELGGSAVEMEGAALAQTAEALGVDHLVIRSLTDRAGSDSIRDFNRFLDEVAANSAQVVRHLLPVL